MASLSDYRTLACNFVQAAAYGATRAIGGPQGQALSSIDTSKYELVGSAGTYAVYRNKAATTTSGNHGTIIPWFVVFALLGLALSAAAIDWFRPVPRPPAGQEDPAPARTPSSSRASRHAREPLARPSSLNLPPLNSQPTRARQSAFAWTPAQEE